MAKLVRHVQSGNYYARIRTRGKLIWKPLETSRIRSFCGCPAKNNVADHFVDINEMVSIGSGAQRPIDDWALSRYGCYLVIPPTPENRWWRWGKVISPCKPAGRKSRMRRR